MHALEYAYLGAIAIGMCGAYTALYFISQHVFKNKIHGMTKRSFYSCATLIVLSLFAYAMTIWVIPDQVIGNRFLHAFGGGVMVFITCLLVVRDARISIERPVFFFLGFVIMTLLGLSNEVAEILLQNHTGVAFAPSLTDTLLDLLSNTTGFVIASLCLIRKVPISYHANQKHSVILR